MIEWKVGLRHGILDTYKKNKKNKRKIKVRVNELDWIFSFNRQGKFNFSIRKINTNFGRPTLLRFIKHKSLLFLFFFLYKNKNHCNFILLSQRLFLQSSWSPIELFFFFFSSFHFVGFFSPTEGMKAPVTDFDIIW